MNYEYLLPLTGPSRRRLSVRCAIVCFVVIILYHGTMTCFNKIQALCNELHMRCKKLHKLAELNKKMHINCAFSQDKGDLIRYYTGGRFRNMYIQTFAHTIRITGPEADLKRTDKIINAVEGGEKEKKLKKKADASAFSLICGLFLLPPLSFHFFLNSSVDLFRRKGLTAFSAAAAAAVRAGAGTGRARDISDTDKDQKSDQKRCNDISQYRGHGRPLFFYFITTCLFIILCVLPCFSEAEEMPAAPCGGSRHLL